MTLQFTVREPISTNRAYGRTERKDNAAGPFGGRRGFFVTDKGGRFKSALQSAALAARSISDWPVDPWRVARARVSYQLFDYRGDVDGPRKLIKDSFERILYQNDRVVEDGPAPLPIRDGRGKRVVVTVELLLWRSVEEAHRLRLAAERRALKRLTAPRRVRTSFPHKPTRST